MMINGINFITDDKGNKKAILLDLILFKKEGINADIILKELACLQQLIDEASVENKSINTWDQAKEKLKNLKP